MTNNEMLHPQGSVARPYTNVKVRLRPVADRGQLRRIADLFGVPATTSARRRAS